MKVLALTLDGYSNWVAISQQIIDLPEFTLEACAQWLADNDAEDEDDDTDVEDIINGFEEMDGICVLPNAISLNGEETGDLFIKMEE